MMQNIAYLRLHALCLALEIEWDGDRPHCCIACAGFSDEHWQVFHPMCMEMPTFVILPDGTVERHPDGLPSALDVSVAPFA